MERFILYRKQVGLKKNKDFSLAIPVMVNPKIAMFSIEITNTEVSKGPINIVLYIKNTSSKIKHISSLTHPEEVISKEISLTGTLTEFVLGDNYDTKGEYIFFGGRSNAEVLIAITVKEDTEAILAV